MLFSVEIPSRLRIMTTIWLSLFLIAFVIFTWLNQFWKSRRAWRMVAHLPGPPTIPFFGNALEFFGSNKDIMTTLLNLPERYPAPFRLVLGNSVYIVIKSPSDLQVLCNNSKALSKAAEYDHLKPIIKNGLFTASGPIWKKHRKLIMPTFNQKILNSFVNVFVKQSEILVQQLEKKVGVESFDAFHYLSRFSVDSICETTMGVKVNAQIEESPFLDWVNRAVEVAFKKMFHIWLRIDMIYKLTSYAKQEKEATEKTQDFVDEIIKQKKEEYITKQKNCESDLIEVDETPKLLSTLDLMIELSSNESSFTDEELRDEVTTIVMAGSDTSAVSLGFILIMLGMHPDHQEKIYEEVMDILGPDGSLEYEDLKRLPYTERVIKETLRLFPPGPVIGRSVDEDIRLQSCTVPAGSSVLLHIIAMHRDPELYPDPLKFDPDRFLPEEVVKRHPYSWMPFSAGPRNCIGMNYAMMQMKTVVAYLIRKYRFKTEYKCIGGLEIKMDLLIKPVHGQLISIELRE